jgi:hypothetical protein
MIIAAVLLLSMQHTGVATMKNFLFALALSAPLALALAPSPSYADTDVKFRFYFGEPHYAYRVGPDYVYRKGFGWHRQHPALRDKLSCGEARRVVRNHGYRIISTRDCSGRTYVFRTSSKGKVHLIYVNARTGGLWRG